MEHIAAAPPGVLEFAADKAFQIFFWVAGGLIGLIIAILGWIASWARSEFGVLHKRVSDVRDDVKQHDTKIAVIEDRLDRLPRMEDKLDSLLERHGLAVHREA